MMSALLADPLGSSPLAAAVSWLEATVLGTVATTLALIAIAGIGLMMLTGRLHIRRGATVILGCFILFGAPGIAIEIERAARLASAPTDVGQRLAPPPSPLTAVPKPVSPSQNYDPYAGASLPPD